MKTKLFLLLLVLSGSTAIYGQDTLSKIMKANNSVIVSFMRDESAEIVFLDTVTKRKTINDIAKHYRMSWTAEDIDRLVNTPNLSSRIDVLNYKLGNSGWPRTITGDQTYLQWAEFSLKNGQERKDDIYKSKGKYYPDLKPEDFQPWIIVEYYESEIYSEAKIRAELASKNITRVYFRKLDRPTFEERSFFMDDDFVVAPPPPPPPPMPEGNGVLTVIDEPAQFPGGTSALMKYMKDNLRYPERAVKEGLEGKVYVKFIVRADGNIEEETVVKKMPGCPECDMEAIRLAKSMPKWIPGKNKGKAVDSYFNLPVTFKLQ